LGDNATKTAATKAATAAPIGAPLWHTPLVADREAQTTRHHVYQMELFKIGIEAPWPNVRAASLHPLNARG
jgi:hypothetical protein